MPLLFENTDVNATVWMAIVFVAAWLVVKGLMLLVRRLGRYRWKEWIDAGLDAVDGPLLLGLPACGSPGFGPCHALSANRCRSDSPRRDRRRDHLGGLAHHCGHDGGAPGSRAPLSDGGGRQPQGSCGQHEISGAHAGPCPAGRGRDDRCGADYVPRDSCDRCRASRLGRRCRSGHRPRRTPVRRDRPGVDSDRAD